MPPFLRRLHPRRAAIGMAGIRPSATTAPWGFARTRTSWRKP